MKIRLRRFNLSDLEAVMKIEKASFPQPWPEVYFKKLYKEHPNDFLVAEASPHLSEQSEGREMNEVQRTPLRSAPPSSEVADLAGKVAGYILGYVKPNKSGSIKTLAVDSNFRRRGIGRKLVNFIIQRLKEKSVKEVFLHTRRKNRAASSFYKKLGFRIIKIVKKYYRNGDDAYLMKREL